MEDCLVSKSAGPWLRLDFKTKKRSFHKQLKTKQPEMADTQIQPQPANDNNVSDSDQFVEAVTAAIPPGMQRSQKMTTDELLAEMNRTPLFMTSLDEGDGEGGENVMLEAIKAIAYEGTKAEVAANFREQGNEAARAKLWRDAREFYSKAIGTLRGLLGTVDAPEDPEVKVMEEPDEEEEKRKEKAIEEACLANRALCELEMSIGIPTRMGITP